MYLSGTTKLPFGQIPMMLHNGELNLQTQSGKMTTLVLDTHSHIYSEKPREMEREKVKLKAVRSDLLGSEHKINFLFEKSPNNCLPLNINFVSALVQER